MSEKVDVSILETGLACIVIKIVNVRMSVGLRR